MIVLKEKDFNDKNLFYKEIDYGSGAKGLVVSKSYGLKVPKFIILTQIELNENLEEIKAVLVKELKNEGFNEELKYQIKMSPTSSEKNKYNFNGVFETYVNVNYNDISIRTYDLIKESSTSNKLERYLLNNNIPVDEVKFNIIIQEILPATYNGILFTANPNGVLSESLVVLGKGSIEEIVSLKTPISTSYISNLEESYFYEANNGAPRLSVKVLSQLREDGELISTEYEDPCEIEFSIIDGEVIYKRIRNLSESNFISKIFLDNKFTRNTLFEASLPLSNSFYLEFIEKTIHNMFLKILSNNTEMELYKDKINNVVSSSSGSLYINLLNLIYLTNFINDGDKVIRRFATFESRFTQNENLDDKVSKILTLKTKVKFNSLLNKSLPRLKELNKEYSDLYIEYIDAIQKENTIEGLKKIYNALVEKISYEFYVVFLNNINTGILIEDYCSDKNNIIEYIKQSPYEGIISDLIPIISDSDGMVKDISNDDIDDKKEEIEDYLVKYFNVYPNNLYIENTKYIVDSNFIKNYLLTLSKYYSNDGDNSNSYSLTKKTEAKIETRLLKKNQVNKILDGIKEEEVMRMNIANIVSQFRLIFNKMGNIWVTQNKVNKMEDIVYLTRDEVFNVDKIDNPCRLIEERRSKNSIIKNIPKYNVIEYGDNVFDRMYYNGNAIKEIKKIDPNNIEISTYYYNEENLQNSSFDNIVGEVNYIDRVEKIKDPSFSVDRIVISSINDVTLMYHMMLSKALIVIGNDNFQLKEFARLHNKAVFFIDEKYKGYDFKNKIITINSMDKKIVVSKNE